MDSEILFLLDYRRSHRKCTDDRTLGKIQLSWLKSVRLKIIILMFFCIFCTNLLRINLNVALPFMVNDTTDIGYKNVSSEFYRCEHRSGSYPGAYLFQWSILVQTSLLSASYWGEALGTLPAAHLVKNRGCKPVLTASIGAASLIAIFIPSAAFFGFYYVIILRFISGIALSFVYPGLLIAVKNWIPQHERSNVLFTFASGFCLSHFLGSPFIVVLCAIPNNYGGWPIIFYLACNATFGFIWMVCFTLTATSKPDRHLNIDRGEKYFIADCLKEDSNEVKTIQNNFPTNWRSYILSSSVLFTLLNHFAFFSAFRYMESVLLIYLKRGLYISVPNTLLGLFDSVQYLAFATFLYIFNLIGKLISQKFSLNQTSTAETFGALGSLSLGFGLLILPFAQCYHPWWILVFFCFIYCLSGSYGRSFVTLIFRYIHLDKYWTMLIVAKTVADLGGAVSITLSGLVQEFTDYSWKSCFSALSLLLVLMGFISLIHCSVSKSKNLALTLDIDSVLMETNNAHTSVQNNILYENSCENSTEFH